MAGKSSAAKRAALFREHIHAHNRRHRADPAAVRAWARPLLHRARACGDIPAAGSPAWQALPGSDPRQLAAVVIAGLAWLDESTPHAIAARIAATLNEIDTAILARQKAVSWSVSAALGTRFCYGPDYLELELRRAHPELRDVMDPDEVRHIDHLTRAVGICRQLVLDPAVSPHDAQVRARTQALTAPTAEAAA